MDVVFNNVLQDLNNFQSKIASLFQDLIKEKTYYKENLDHLYKNLKETSTETEKLKKEIEMLREDNLNMRNIIHRGIQLFKSLDFSKTSKQTNELEALKTVFLEYSTKIENSNSTENASSKEKKEICNKRYEMSDEEIQKEIESLRSMNFCTNLFNDDIIFKNTSKECPLQRSSSEKTHKTFVTSENHEEKVQNERGIESNKVIEEPKSFDLDYICATIDSETVRPVELLNENNKSPVFKDFNGRRNCLNFAEGSDVSSPESWNSSLVNEKFLEKTISSDISSPEKSPRTDKGSPSSRSPGQNWAETSFKIPKFRIPPGNILKKSHAREVEKSSSGMKILTQTFLNVDCFKRKTPEKNKNFGDENEGRSVNCKKIPEEDVDDIVIEVPKKADKVLQDINNKNTTGNELEEVPFMTPPLLTEPDLDETYISSSIIRKHMLEGETNDQTPLKRPALERPAVRDFPYKDKPVRKKAERMNLPGHACAECNKYYEQALGDIGTQDMKKILNKCSRHRQRYSPSLDDTPRDYWKPYLTSSTIISPNS